MYANDQARNDLAWQPRYDFAYVIGRLAAGDGPRSPLAQLIGVKGYHRERFARELIPWKGNERLGRIA